MSRIVAGQHHEHDVCSHGLSDPLLSGSALANLSPTFNRCKCNYERKEAVMNLNIFAYNRECPCFGEANYQKGVTSSSEKERKSFTSFDDCLSQGSLANEAYQHDSKWNQLFLCLEPPWSGFFQKDTLFDNRLVVPMQDRVVPQNNNSPPFTSSSFFFGCNKDHSERRYGSGFLKGYMALCLASYLEDEKSGNEDNHNENDCVTEVENVNENENKIDGNDHRGSSEENSTPNELTQTESNEQSGTTNNEESNSAQNESKQSESNKRTENTDSTSTTTNSESNSTETESKEHQQIPNPQIVKEQATVKKTLQVSKKTTTKIMTIPPLIKVKEAPQGDILTSTSGLEAVPLLLLRFRQLGGEIVARNVVGKW
ncbi:hypothetical protein Tco_0608810 [Tanacetum coccineum]